VRSVLTTLAVRSVLAVSIAAAACGGALAQDQSQQSGQQSEQQSGQRRDDKQRFEVTRAEIDGGRLVIEGTAKKAHQKVRLENQFETQSDEEGRFAFSVVHHPADCVVVVRARGATRRAVVANCGELGERGPRGIKGAAGVGADQWWYQTLSANAAFPAELRDENGGLIAGRFYGLLFCAIPDIEFGGTDLRAAQFLIQHSSEGEPPRWHVSRLTPDSASDLLPIVFEEDEVLKLKNNSSADPSTYVCRFERLAS
jgi:hypothetical protein